jgi:hypothetical protein
MFLVLKNIATNTMQVTNSEITVTNETRKQDSLVYVLMTLLTVLINVNSQNKDSLRIIFIFEINQQTSV